MENEEIKVDYTKSSPLELAKAIVRALDAKNARDIKVLHVEEATSLTEYFVLCTGNSNTQIKSYCDEVDYKIGLGGVKPESTEGFNEASWVVMDYGPVIVHIFNRENRVFYNLEKLWSQSSEVDVSDLITEK